MNVVFRTDASLDIGTGHVMRCLTLARALRGRGAVCRFVTRALTGHLADRIMEEGFQVTLLPAPQGEAPDGPPAHAYWAGVNCAIDAAESSATLDAAPADWVVQDHYAFDARWQKEVGSTGAKLMVIDDLADRPHDCQLLLDQNFGHAAADYEGLLPDGCAQLIGPQYALLRPEFAAMRAAALTARAGRGLNHLLITMGGVDLADATSTVLIALHDAPLPVGLRITVIMGSKAPALDSVRALAQNMPRPTNVVVDVTDIAERMAAADLAIGAAGSTTWERCCLGLPSIILQIAENQAGIAQKIVAAGAALDPGPIQASDFTRSLHAALAEASDPARLDEMSQRAAAICDGDGSARVLTALLPTEVNFRPASREDSRRVWEWRKEMDNSLRMVGQDTPFVQHDRWFCQALNDPDRIIRVAMQGDLPCGYVRLDRTDEVQARVSICLSSETRGQGLGRWLLKEADREGKRLGMEQLNAEIHPINTMSRRVFERAGYMKGDMTDGFLTYYRTLGEAT